MCNFLALRMKTSNGSTVISLSVHLLESVYVSLPSWATLALLLLLPEPFLRMWAWRKNIRVLEAGKLSMVWTRGRQCVKSS